MALFEYMSSRSAPGFDRLAGKSSAATLPSHLILLGERDRIVRHRARTVLLGTAVFAPWLWARPAIAPDGVTPAEQIVLAPGLVSTLSAVALEESVRLLDWPIEPGQRQEVHLTRRDIYAADARVIVVDQTGERDASRSSLRFFFGEIEGREPNRVVVVLDPERGLLHGHFLSSVDWFELRPRGEGRDDYILAPSTAFVAAGTPPLDVECAQDTLSRAQGQAFDGLVSVPAAIPAGTLLRATLAVDTDNELMQLKFADSTPAATNYIANLFALMTAVYERDLGVRLLQGTTFLRVSTTPDPYLQSGTGNASSAKLVEFASYWNANNDSIPRALAMMLSGKQSSPSSASGIAYVNSLCEQDSGYSFNQVFKFATNTASSDTRLVAHENGHNFGSRHTHCYLNPTPIDMCYNQESGCYSGPTSCPASSTINGVPNVKGTVMSYCHQLGGCSASSVFHPRTVSLLVPIVESHEGECIFRLSNPKEASPAGDLHAKRVGPTSLEVSYTPACGATDHTLYVGDLTTLRATGIAWTERTCALGTSGNAVLDVRTASAYFVVVGNNGSVEGSYGRGTAGERPPAGTGTGCQYTQDLSGTCP
jgi:hypothetical protein